MSNTKPQTLLVYCDFYGSSTGFLVLHYCPVVKFLNQPKSSICNHFPERGCEQAGAFPTVHGQEKDRVTPNRLPVNRRADLIQNKAN